MKWTSWLLALALLGGCSSSSPPTTSSAANPPGPAVAARTREVIRVELGGQTDFSLEPEGTGVKVVCGGKTFTTKIEADRVKVFEGETLQAKAKRKEDGFELEDGGGGRLLRCKWKSGHPLKVEDGNGQVTLQLDQMRLLSPQGGFRGELRNAAGGLELVDPTKKVVARLAGPVPKEAGLALGLTQLTPAQRATVVLYLAEVGP